MGTEIIPKHNGGKAEIIGFYDGQRESFGLVAQDKSKWDAFVYRVAELAMTNAAFRGCDAASQVQIARRISETGLWPIDGGRAAYIVTYGQKAQYGVGPGGWIELLYRAGATLVTYAIVHEGDEFDRGTILPRRAPTLTPSSDPRRSTKPYQFAVAYVEWPDHAPDWAIADIGYLERVEKSSPAGKNGPWGKWPEQMAAAKALKLLAREVCLRPTVHTDVRREVQAADALDAIDAAEAELESVRVGAPAQIEPPKTDPTPPRKPRGEHKRKDKPGEATHGGDAAQGQTAPQQAPSVTPAPAEGSADRSESGGAASPGPKAPPTESVEVRAARAMAKEIAALGTDARSAFIGEHGDCPDEPELLAWFSRIGFDAARKAARAFVDARKGGK